MAFPVIIHHKHSSQTFTLVIIIILLWCVCRWTTPCSTSRTRPRWWRARSGSPCTRRAPPWWSPSPAGPCSPPRTPTLRSGTTSRSGAVQGLGWGLAVKVCSKVLHSVFLSLTKLVPTFMNSVQKNIALLMLSTIIGEILYILHCFNV